MQNKKSNKQILLEDKKQIIKCRAFFFQPQQIYFLLNQLTWKLFFLILSIKKSNYFHFYSMAVQR